MKLKIEVSPKVSLYAEGTHKEIWEQIAAVQDVFGEVACGKCGGENIRYVVREDSNGNKYYELLCMSCYAKLTFGQNRGDKEGCLFARRIENKQGSICGLKPGTRLPDNGWIKYNKETKKNE